MKLDAQQVRHVAKLARLAVSADEETRLATQLSVILDAVDTLSELDCDGVPPTTFAVTDGQAPSRPDEPRDELTIAEALKNAPARHAESFSIPKVDALGGDDTKGRR